MIADHTADAEIVAADLIAQAEHDTAARAILASPSSDGITPEHLEIQTVDADAVGRLCANYGGLFIGTRAAEVLGDYGAGPNHTLPTGGTGRYTGGLSVLHAAIEALEQYHSSSAKSAACMWRAACSNSSTPPPDRRRSLVQDYDDDDSDVEGGWWAMLSHSPPDDVLLKAGGRTGVASNCADARESPSDLFSEAGKSQASRSNLMSTQKNDESSV